MPEVFGTCSSGEHRLWAIWWTGKEREREKPGKAGRWCEWARKSNFANVIFLISISKLIKYSISTSHTGMAG